MAAVKKRVFVAGGGAAGMECAWVAAKRGHEVTLFERSGRLGGQIHLAGAVPGKGEFLGAIESLIARIERAGVRIRLSTELTSGMVNEGQPDVLVIATGARAMEIDTPGCDQPHVVNAWDILLERVPEIGKDVVIVGGNATGCETAHFVAQMGIPEADLIAFLILHSAEGFDRVRDLLFKPGRKITVIDMMARMAANMGASSRWPLMKKLKLLGVELRPKTKLVEIARASVVVETDRGKESIPADTVIIAVGSQSVANLPTEIKGNGVKVIVIGDAKEPRKISDAVREGFDAALNI